MSGLYEMLLPCVTVEMWLSNKDFLNLVANAPLVSIDLVITNCAGKVLLGRRQNRPAQCYWFVPGGRILKNETLDAAFNRLTLLELGVLLNRDQARLLDVYEHFYDDNVSGVGNGQPSTYYIVLGYHLQVPDACELKPPEVQHDCYKWWSPHEMQVSEHVHMHTRAYLPALTSYLPRTAR